MRNTIFFLWLVFFVSSVSGQQVNVDSGIQKKSQIIVLQPSQVVHPFDELVIVCTQSGSVTITDGRGIEYFKTFVSGKHSFLAGGAPGIHTARLYDRKGNLCGSATFRLEAKTSISDGGKISGLFNLLYEGMLVYSPSG
jgi:hypothetical protein